MAIHTPGGSTWKCLWPDSNRRSWLLGAAGFEPPLYRMRIGDFRAYYRISGDEVVILAVTLRKDSDKRLKRIAEEDGPGYGRKRGRARGR